MNDKTKMKNKKCPYCTPTDPENPCVLATAKTVIDGKEYSACCSSSNKIETKEAKKPLEHKK
jgi:hypothetical protein